VSEIEKYEKFDGFVDPQENWSKLPHSLIGALPLISSLAEAKVILYILRHTWGYREYGEVKRITADEFANGRKTATGTRIDNGIGMNEPAIRDGIKRAVDHGFIVAEVDDSDAGRIRKSYALNIQGVENRPSEGRKSTARGIKINPRSEKETIEKKLGIETPESKRPRNPYFDAVCVVCGIDVTKVPPGSASSIAKAARDAKAVGWTVGDILAYGKWREAKSWGKVKGAYYLVEAMAQSEWRQPKDSYTKTKPDDAIPGDRPPQTFS
jgi:hypothetical protein